MNLEAALALRQLTREVTAGGPGSGRRPGFGSPFKDVHNGLIRDGFVRTGSTGKGASRATGQRLGDTTTHHYKHEDGRTAEIHVDHASGMAKLEGPYE